MLALTRLPVILLTYLMTSAYAEPFRLFIGTYTNTTAKGIYTTTFDATTGTLSEPALAAEIDSPSFLAITPGRHALYAVSEPTQSVCAYAIDAGNGKLTKLNALPSGGSGPCDVSVDATGRTAVIANYGGGSTVAYRLAEDGSLIAQTSFDQHSHASAAHPNRQNNPHAHGVTFSPDNRFLFSPDLGGDRVYIYIHDTTSSALTPHATQPWLDLAPGSGPRHAEFSPDGKQLYIINELANTITVAAYDTTTGTLSVTQTLPTLPADFIGSSSTAEIVISADGRTIYGSNRGHDSIVVYDRRSTDGTLTLQQIVSCGGQHPRHFALSPDGQWLLCANMDSNDITTFRIDSTTGELTTSGHPPVALARPVCLRFL